MKAQKLSTDLPGHADEVRPTLVGSWLSRVGGWTEACPPPPNPAHCTTVPLPCLGICCRLESRWPESGQWWEGQVPPDVSLGVEGTVAAGVLGCPALVVVPRGGEFHGLSTCPGSPPSGGSWDCVVPPFAELGSPSHSLPLFTDGGDEKPPRSPGSPPGLSLHPLPALTGGLRLGDDLENERGLLSSLRPHRGPSAEQKVEGCRRSSLNPVLGHPQYLAGVSRVGGGWAMTSCCLF